MEQFHVAICDDENYYIQDIKGYIYEYEQENNTSFHINIYNSGYDLTNDINKGILLNMIFLDVEMPKISGVETAKEIRRINEDVVICFVTSHESYALDAFAVDAIGYIVKPVSKLEVFKILKKGITHTKYLVEKVSADKKYLTVKTNREDILVDVSDIVYIEKTKNSCIFHMKDKDITSYNTLTNVYEGLDNQIFCYSHQGFIINFIYVKEIKRNMVCLGQNLNVPLSRKFYKVVKERHMDKINRLRISMEE